MAEFVETVNEIKKICAEFKSGCKRCPLDELATMYGECNLGIMNNPKQTEVIIAQWNESHMRNTWIAKLNEELPGCDMDAVISGTCPGFFFPGAPRAKFDDGCGGKCKACWHGEAKEKK